MDALDLRFCRLQPRIARANEEHAHPHHEFHLVVHGQGSFSAGTRRVACRPGSAWYTVPGTRHRMVPEAGSVILQYVCWVDLVPPLAELLYRHWDELSVRQVGLGAEGAFWSMQEGVRSGDVLLGAAAAHRFAAWLYDLLAGGASSEALPPLVQRMQEWLADHVDLKPALADLARMAGVTPAHAVRLFQRHVGVPPMTWHRHHRLEIAGRWLSSSDLPVQDIAARVGYHDPLHFSRAFRAWSGLSPSAWRLRCLIPAQDQYGSALA